LSRVTRILLQAVNTMGIGAFADAQWCMTCPIVPCILG
jgi:hypothetical protein